MLMYQIKSYKINIEINIIKKWEQEKKRENKFTCLVRP